MKYTHSLILASAFLVTGASATTIIRANTPNANGQPATNAVIGNTFGDNVTGNVPASSPFVFETTAGAFGFVGTPNIDLTWSVINNITASTQTRWDSHSWTNAGGGALQLNDSSGAAAGDSDAFIRNDVHSIAFTPGAGSGVILNGFNFIGDTNGNTYQYDWRVVRVSDSAVVSSGQTVQWTTNTALGVAGFNGAPTVNINFTGDLDTAYRLDLAQSIGSVGNISNIAIDNLSFDQIPEPSVALLGGLGLLALLRRRRA